MCNNGERSSAVIRWNAIQYFCSSITDHRCSKSTSLDSLVYSKPLLIIKYLITIPVTSQQLLSFYILTERFTPLIPVYEYTFSINKYVFITTHVTIYNNNSHFTHMPMLMIFDLACLSFIFPQHIPIRLRRISQLHPYVHADQLVTDPVSYGAVTLSEVILSRY